MVRAGRQRCWLNRKKHVLADSEFESFEFVERLQGKAKLMISFSHSTLIFIY